MKNLTKNVQNTNAHYPMWQRGEKIVLGVSGGRDSMCLLDVFVRIAKKEDLHLIVAHVNHGLRGSESDADQALVERICAEHDITCAVLVVPCSKKGTSEAQWRAVRNSFFRDVLQTHHAKTLALAHHQNDHAETLLLHLLRGSGMRGLSNMRFLSKRADLGTDVRVIRPFLSTDRLAIDAHCSVFDVAYHDDSTNTDNTFTRNRVRNELLPYLATSFNPEIVSTLASTARILGDDYDALPPVEPFWSRDTTTTTLAYSFAVQDLTALKPSVARRALRSLISTLGDGAHSVRFGHIEEIRHALTSGKNKHQTITAGNLIVERKNATVKVTLKSS